MYKIADGNNNRGIVRIPKVRTDTFEFSFVDSMMTQYHDIIFFSEEEGNRWIQQHSSPGGHEEGRAGREHTHGDRRAVGAAGSAAYPFRHRRAVKAFLFHIPEDDSAEQALRPDI